MIPEHPALRLVGICKTCHKAAHGYLRGGDGPFICFECVWGKQQPTSSDRTTPTNWFYTFTTTSNSAGGTPDNE